MDDSSQLEPESRQAARHPILTFVLSWLAIANIIAAVGSPFFLVSIRRQSVPDFPEWVGWPFAALSVLSVACTVAMFRWKRWGFYGYALAAVLVFALNVYAGVGVLPAMLGFSGTIFLFIALQIGGEKRAWPKLR
jgi:hypothetical protein